MANLYKAGKMINTDGYNETRLATRVLNAHQITIE